MVIRHAATPSRRHACSVSTDPTEHRRICAVVHSYLIAVTQPHQQALTGLGAATQGFELRQQLRSLHLPRLTQQLQRGQPEIVRLLGASGLLRSDKVRQLLRKLCPVLLVQLDAEIDRQLTDMAANSNHLRVS